MKDNASYLKEFHDIQKKNEDMTDKISVFDGMCYIKEFLINSSIELIYSIFR